MLIDQIEDYAIFMLDPNGYIQSWNKGAENIKGYTADEIIGQHISVFYTEKDRRENMPGKILSEALRNNIYKTEGWRVKKDGSVFWAHVVLTTVYDDHGRLAGFAKVTRDITELKKSEDQKILINAELERLVKINTDEIISKERRFRKLIENSYDGISLLDRNLQVFYRSRSAERINGWNDVERAVQPYESLVHPDDLPQVVATLNDVLEHPNKPMLSTYRTQHKKGHYIWIECLLNNRLDDPDIGAVVCNFKDVTDRVVAEEQLREKNKQIENILDSITDGFITLDKNFNYTYANRRLGEMLGLDSQWLIGRNVWETFPDVVGSSTYKAFYKAMETGQYVWNEDYYAPLNFWEESHIYPTPQGLSVFIRDITERKLAEASLLQSESNLRSVFENSEHAIILFDIQGIVVSFNHNASELAALHFHKELKAGLSAFYYSSPERKDDVLKMIESLKEKSSITYEVSYPLPHNQTVWYEVRWVSVLNNEKQPSGIILTLKNITEKKMADLERDRMTADLIQRNKDLEQFTYIISHNLRAPVANIMGLADIMQLNGVDGDSENGQALDALTESVGNLDKVIIDLNNILQVNNAANETLEMVSLPRLVDEVKTAIADLVVKNRAKISCDFSGISEMMSLKGYMYSIFQNLIVNSIKYKRAGADPLIGISTRLDGSKACICFKDNGRGIDLLRYGRHLFGLYKRFDVSVEGKGMGLFMVKMQVERLGGKIKVKSNLDEGTEFILEFPLKPVQG
ncbi:PAS domain-containing sensor histidine kinase [Mucilaginibacter mali]|uniref:histidine kinase n=1 Tax=Mucilaginibacter mali TaxID=2740462 RepID=A0A7D4UCL8_9SPHI|nr:PAS domain-containing sensor histidine kinase [Mucilaginibacter mali]QKJ29479.1 PAS domain-containing sensor histidine kinase [Mucilaginibacter mali]